MNVTIVGGGSAGWMTAATLAKARPDWNLTLIEGKNIPTVGVGESTLLPITQWCNFIGIDEKEFVKETDATFKLSIKFTDFYKKGEAFHYPFGEPNLENNIAFANDWWFKKFLNPNLKNSDYADCIYPEQMAYVNENKFNKQLPRAYHFDATKFGLWLKKHKCKNVKHIIEDIVTYKVGEEGIESLNSKYKADLFIDCTGFRSLLLGKILEEPFESYEDLLPNNSAWATKLPYTNKKLELQPYTNCTAYNNGWIWNIPLWTRMGTGYVYSDKFISDDEALKEFKNYLGRQDLEFKNIKMRIGIHKRLWVKNVAAIGLSAGFIEPLESSGLFTVHEFLISLLRNTEREKISQWDKDNFTFMCKSDFRAFAEFVALHYALSHRKDTPYWLNNFNKNWDEKLINLDLPNLSGMCGIARNRKFDYFFDHTSGAHCIAAGMNWSPTDEQIIRYKYGKDIENIKKQWTLASNNLENKKMYFKEKIKNEKSQYDYLKGNFYD